MKISVLGNTNDGEPEMKCLLVDGIGHVSVCAYDGRGKKWRILVIKQVGISRVGGIPARTGWPLDDKGRVKLID